MADDPAVMVTKLPEFAWQPGMYERYGRVVVVRENGGLIVDKKCGQRASISGELALDLEAPANTHFLIELLFRSVNGQDEVKIEEGYVTIVAIDAHKLRDWEPELLDFAYGPKGDSLGVALAKSCIAAAERAHG